MNAAHAAVPLPSIRPHDLLWLRRADALIADAPLPAWVADEVRRTDAPGVVRRALPPGAGCVAIGLRGAARSERLAAQVAADDVVRVTTPEEIARRRAWRRPPWAGGVAALRLLERVAPLLDASPLAWGVTGGVGFALASGRDVQSPASDLDLLLRAPSSADAAALRALAAALHGLVAPEARLDVQVETPLGAFALAEWSRGGAGVLLKTSAGPRLVANPWDAAPRRAP